MALCPSSSQRLGIDFRGIEMVAATSLLCLVRLTKAGWSQDERMQVIAPRKMGLV